CVVVLDDAAVATSGPYWQRYEVEGRECSHTIDPRTGRPVTDAPAAVSVVAGDAMRADAWSTALAVMGVGAGERFARVHGLAARRKRGDRRAGGCQRRRRGRAAPRCVVDGAGGDGRGRR